MDKNLRNNILKEYWAEYSNAAAAAKPGLLGAFMRWNDRMQKKLGGDKAEINFPSAAAIALGIAAGGVAAILSGGVVPLIAGVSTFFAYMGVAITGYGRIASQTRKNVNADIENGTLLNRYKDVLSQKVKRIEHQSRALDAALTEVTSGFNSAAAKQTPPRARLLHRLTHPGRKQKPSL